MEVYETTIPIKEERPIRLWHLAVVLLLFLITVASFGWAEARSVELRIDILDIGQGDAILVSTESGNQVLIDGGKDRTILSKLGGLLPAWDRTIDVVVATHKHSDHIGGLVYVLEQYDVESIVHGFEAYDSATARAWEAAVSEEGAHVTEALSGTAISLGSSISLTVLYPSASRAGYTTKEANDDSIVLLLQHGDVLMLLMGDAESETERALLAAGAIPVVDVIKAGHHGSITSSTNALLTTARPQAVVISVGEGNRYGHPHQVILARLAEHGIPYYRTDRNGDVRIISDGRSFSISTER